MSCASPALWVPKLIRRDYALAVSQGRQRRRRSRSGEEKRKKIAWEIDRKLTNEAVRPMLYYMRGGTCMRREVKNMTIMVNSIYNGWRLEDVWLER